MVDIREGDFVIEYRGEVRIVALAVASLRAWALKLAGRADHLEGRELPEGPDDV